MPDQPVWVLYLSMKAAVQRQTSFSTDPPSCFVYSSASGTGLEGLGGDAFVSKWIKAALPPLPGPTSGNRKHQASSSGGVKWPPKVPSSTLPTSGDRSRASGHQSCLICYPLSVRTSDTTGLDPSSCFARRWAYSGKPISRRDALSSNSRAYFNKQSQLFIWRRARVKKTVDSFSLDGCPVSERYKQFLCEDACFYFRNEWRLGRVHQPPEERLRLSKECEKILEDCELETESQFSMKPSCVKRSDF